MDQWSDQGWLCRAAKGMLHHTWHTMALLATACWAQVVFWAGIFKRQTGSPTVHWGCLSETPSTLSNTDATACHLSPR